MDAKKLIEDAFVDLSKDHSMFKASDIGVVGDADKILSGLLKKMK